MTSKQTSITTDTIQLLPFPDSKRSVHEGVLEATGSFIISMQIDVQLPDAYMPLSVPDKITVRDAFLDLLRLDNNGSDQAYRTMALQWQRDPVTISGIPHQQTLDLAALHQIVNRNLTAYCQQVWQSGPSTRGLIQVDTASGNQGTTQYIWDNGHFVCVHTIPLTENTTSGPEPWSFTATVNGQTIESTNQARFSWSIL